MEVFYIIIKEVKTMKKKKKIIEFNKNGTVVINENFWDFEE